MSIHVSLTHKTHYTYDRLIALGPQLVRLRPAPHCRTRILGYTLRVTPQKHFINWQQDPQSNYIARLAFPEKTNELVVEVNVVAEMAVHNPFDFFLEPQAERFPFKYDKALDHELAPFLLKEKGTPKFDAFLARIKTEILRHPEPAGPGGTVLPVAHSESKSVPQHGGILPAADQLSPETAESTKPATVDFLVNLNQFLSHEIKYLIRHEPGVQTLDETLTLSSGSCRDSSWLLCQLVRHLGVASRFVSGYLIQLTPDVKSLEGPSGTENDFTDLHAWCEVYLPGAGWIGLDPTSGLLAGEGHIPLAATPEPLSAAPISGSLDECKVTFSHHMEVTRIYESPRVTKPYTEDQWREIESLGHQLDAELKKNDCRLSMGGEPTFVSIEDMDGAEWNTLAMGPTKRARADALMRRLKRRLTSGALLHYGQGKWYPGESLPRWSFGCYWRKDGEPVWLDESLFALESKDYGFKERHAEQFIHALASRLNCGEKWIMPAFEDSWYYLWRERRLPSNVDPLKSNLRDEEERARLARVFEQGLDRVTGYALPLQRARRKNSSAWVSGPWLLRPERCYLIPGDSPIGYRLPIDSQPWVSPADYPYIHQQDPMADRPPLPPRQAFVRGEFEATDTFDVRYNLPKGATQMFPTRDEQTDRRPGRLQSASWIVRTALCVEPRHGRLHVFMPPMEKLEDYFELVTAVEETAAALDTPVVIEGYTPPYDPRLSVVKVTPDPGVIEVNVHPAESWDDMVKTTEILYEEARQSKLGTEKFMLDGRHTGTGGGNHIVIGGITPKDSPLLRRPDLLRSLIGYWQNHPSLSFLFSGLFIGPTSQSPRVDEARTDSLYELELAFKRIPAPGDEECPPWLVDRLFRHLLIDATGNTHRAEFCIDKLYPPESASGRLGLLEMRAFEMPPHARMSLAQQLMLRTLIAKFWREPYTQPLVRWGADIHDRWMLPHFVWNDFVDVIEDLQRSGYGIRSEWFLPHLQFRFPLVGEVEMKDIGLELRQALEPWHVLGEESGAGGTVRYVDSSVERLQVKARGLIDSRHLITVNGVTLPLHPTGTNGEYISGIRYRAWQPSSGLHPTIGVHSPLVFDVVDSWNERSLGGCTYHVTHPGGRNYTTFPVNAYEAESRRLSRFFRTGQTPGRIRPLEPEQSPECPFTLDLRKETLATGV